MFMNRFRVLFLNEDYKILDKTVISVMLPSVNTGLKLFTNPVKDIYYPGDSLEFSDLILTFRLDEDWGNWKKIMEWMEKNKEFHTTLQDITFSDVSIQLMDSKKNVIYSVELTDCFPFDVSSLSFSTQTDEISPMTFECVLKVNNMTISQSS